MIPSSLLLSICLHGPLEGSKHSQNDLNLGHSWGSSSLRDARLLPTACAKAFLREEVGFCPRLFAGAWELRVPKCGQGEQHRVPGCSPPGVPGAPLPGAAFTSTDGGRDFRAFPQPLSAGRILAMAVTQGLAFVFLDFLVHEAFLSLILSGLISTYPSVQALSLATSEAGISLG